MMQKNINDTKIKKRITISVVGWILFNIIYLSVDYFNLFSVVGINTDRINLDVVSIIVSNSIVILLYMITYFSLDSRNIKKRKNQRATAELLLFSTYKETLEIVNLFQNDEAAKAALGHCQPDKLTFEDQTKQRYLNLPFIHNEMICKFAGDGIITAKEYESYLDIQSLYKDHINIRVSFADLPGFENYKRDELLEHLNKNIEKFKNNKKEV